MSILIVYCHPSQKSYTHEILETLIHNLNSKNIEYTISDLYAIGFRSDMNAAEYDREGLANMELPIPPDVKQEHEKIKSATGIIFLYPVWWSDCPAKLKGWFDRVYSYGYAYGTDPSSTHEMMQTKDKGIVICTAGHPNDYLQKIGIAESMRNVMLDDRLGERFTNKEMIILGGTMELEKVRKEHHQTIEKICSTFS